MVDVELASHRLPGSNRSKFLIRFQFDSARDNKKVHDIFVVETAPEMVSGTDPPPGSVEIRSSCE